MANENLQIAIEINILLQACFLERKKNLDPRGLDSIIKEYLKIQEFLLVVPDHLPNIQAISKWTIKVIDDDDRLSGSLLGNKLKIFARKLDNYQKSEEEV